MKKEAQRLNRIAEQQYDTLVSWCLKKTKGDRQLAEDCAAEAFLRAQKLGDPPEHPNISGWLRRTARNVLRERRREERAYYRRNVSLEALAESGREVEAPFFERENAFIERLWQGVDEISDEELERIKLELLQALPPADRELIELAYDKRLPLDDIARRTGRSKDAVRVKLSRLADRVTVMVKNYFDEA